MAVSLTEYLTEIQALTKKNLEILKALNNSFYTKSEHLSVTIDETQYVIPSFISLENKLNTLEDNFENLVNAPRTGEAAFDFNGNTQSIEVKGFTNTPPTAFEGLSMEKVASIKTFDHEKNSVFKDFLTPIPFVKIDLANLPSDIHQVNVKKIVVSNPELVSLLKNACEWIDKAENGKEKSVCRPINYATVVKKLFVYEKDKDYVSYDKVYTLPIRYELGTGKYRIEEIVDNYTDENFFEHYELKLDNTDYSIADETIKRNLLEGDYLVTNNDKVKLRIEGVNYSNSTVRVQVENGGFADLCTVDSGNVELSTLKFFAIGNIKENKYLKVPLEEDEFVLLFFAPIQRNSLIQSAWSDGLFFDVYELLDKNDNKTNYKEYYDQSVTNIGDKLFGLVSLASNDFINMSKEEFENITQAKPIIDESALKVVQINNHMSNAETIQEIYNIYNQKENYKLELKNVQTEIDEINEKLNKISFEDITSTRKVYTDQLSGLNERKKELNAAIADCIQEITVAATDTDVPVDNPKYHIRGFFDYNAFLDSIGEVMTKPDRQQVIKIDVQYRYKNANRTTGDAKTIGDTGDIFSDWNIMSSFVSERTPQYGYKFVYPDDSSKVNEPSFNQIDIPISQGETVDLRLRVVYSAGYPFVKTASDWSEIVNIEFPVELRKNISVLSIIEENNSDTTKEAFRGYLDKEGVSEHTQDKLLDQDITYFHKPEHIASGFYTEERRVIPLRDKLQTLTNEIITLKDEVFGTSSDNLLVTLSDGESDVILNPFADNLFVMKDFSSSDKTDELVITTLTLNVQNNSKTSNIKLFSLFPGNYNDAISSTRQSKFDLKDYSLSNLKIPVYNDSYTQYVNSSGAFVSPSAGIVSGTIYKLKVQEQRQNQWIYFRLKDAYNGEDYYSININDVYKNKLYGDIKREAHDYLIDNPGNNGMLAYPHISSNKDICITEFDENNCKIIYPGESVQVNITVQYRLGAGAAVAFNNVNEIEKTLCFDLRNSLFSDPLSYKVKIKAKYSNDLSNNLRKVKKNRYTPAIIN